LVVDLDDGKTGGRVGHEIDVADAEEDDDHEGPLHDAVERHGRDHAVWDPRSRTIDFVTC
jgi:hypothetical protein